LSDRFRERRLDVLHKKSDLPVAQHFNGRQREENRQIFKFQTLTPRRIHHRARFLISIESRDIRAHFFRTRKQFQKQHTTGNNCLVILRGSLIKHPEEGSNAETSVDLYRH